VEVDVVRSSRPARSHRGVVGTIEVQPHRVALHYPEERRSARIEVHAVSIPIAGYLEAEHISIVLSRLHDVRDGELRDDCGESNDWCVSRIHECLPAAAAYAHQ
jgi:hypothetical protein